MQVKLGFLQAINDFNWPKPDQKDRSLLNERQLAEVVAEVSKIIFSCIHIRHAMYAASGVPCTLSEVIINLKKDNEKYVKPDSIPSCLLLMQKATDEEKIGLVQILRVLSENHKGIDETTLKCATLLFGLGQISKIVEDNKKALQADNERRMAIFRKNLETYKTLKRNLRFLPKDQFSVLNLDGRIAAAEAKIEKLKNQSL